MKPFKTFLDEATRIGKRKVPVYAEIEGSRGHYKVVGHVSQSASSIGATKLGKKYGANSAKQTMKLKSKEYPEGPGWILLSGSGPNPNRITVKEN